MTSRFECTINECWRVFSKETALSYFLHVRDEHSQTYKQNKEYIDAKIKVLESEDPELDTPEGIEDARKIVEQRENEADGWAI